MVCRAETKTDMLMWEALRKATDEEMERDPTVCVMGATIHLPQAQAWLPLAWEHAAMCTLNTANIDPWYLMLT